MNLKPEMRNSIVLLTALVSVCLALPTEWVETDPEITGGHFQGDILLDLSDFSRNGLKNENLRWPNGIVFYHVADYIDDAHKQQIQDAIAVIEANSCVTFEEVDETAPAYVSITSLPGGCYSTVGYRNRVQPLNLQPAVVGNGCFRLGSIIHEFLHALGFFHTHIVPDRDYCVTIAEENIIEGNEDNFAKLAANRVDYFGEIEYEYSSIMHPKPTLYSKNGELTIVPLVAGAEAVMGQRDRMTQGDINKLNRMYKCSVWPTSTEETTLEDSTTEETSTTWNDESTTEEDLTSVYCKI